MAALLPGLSLCLASGLSSHGLICCFAMCLRYAALLYLWLCAHSFLDQRFRGLLACPSLSSLLWFCKLLWVLFSHMVHNLRDGATLAGSWLVCPRSERRFNMFSLSLLGCFFVLSLPLGIWSPYGSGVGRFPLLHDRRLSWCFSLWMGFEPLSEALLGDRSLLEVVLAEDESLRMSLALSSVLPCPMLWLHVRLHDSCSRSTVVLGALPLILPDGVRASVGGSS